VIPGLPATTGTRTLYLAVPGTASAQVKVTAVTSRGSYHPTGGSGIDLAGNSAGEFPLPSLSGVGAALEISSNVPVAAAVLVPGGSAGAPGAMSAAAAPVTEQAVAADLPATSAGQASLVISAPGKAATVRIQTATSKISFSGQQATVVHVAGGHTVVERVRAPGRKPVSFAAVVTPEAGSGPVFIGRVISSHGGIVRTIMPMTSALTWVPLPVAEQALDEGRAGR
jgi:hypothetical protein